MNSEASKDRPSTAQGLWPGQAWFALRTAPRHEKKVHERLTNQGLESFLPLCERLSRWKDRRMRITAPLFPGYSFARFGPAERPRVIKTAGVASIVGLNGIPEPVEDREIDNLKRLMGSTLPYDPCVGLDPGMEVEVVRGPLTGVRGILVRKDSRYRLVVSVNVIRQGAAVEIDAADVAAV